MQLLRSRMRGFGGFTSLGAFACSNFIYFLRPRAGQGGASYAWSKKGYADCEGGAER